MKEKQWTDPELRPIMQYLEEKILPNDEKKPE